MVNEKWYYYNHAMLPQKAPHEDADVSVINDGSIWNNENRPLLARWTTDFDCGYETEWWYCIKDDEISLDTMKSKKRKKILSALENVDVRIINVNEYIDAMFDVYSSAFSKYDFSIGLSKSAFIDKILSENYEKNECWGAFLKGTDTLVAYRKCILFDGCVDFSESKYHPEYLNLRIAEALTFVMLDYYLNTARLKYVFSGERTINHATNMQGFYEEHFGFRKAYCKLNIAYRPFVGGAVGILRLFSKLVSAIGAKSSLFHSIDAILKMDKIAKNCKKTKE